MISAYRQMGKMGNCGKTVLAIRDRYVVLLLLVLISKVLILILLAIPLWSESRSNEGEDHRLPALVRIMGPRPCSPTLCSNPGRVLILRVGLVLHLLVQAEPITRVVNLLGGVDV
jgi:hypothetical protein